MGHSGAGGEGLTEAVCGAQWDRGRGADLSNSWSRGQGAVSTVDQEARG